MEKHCVCRPPGLSAAPSCSLLLAHPGRLFLRPPPAAQRHVCIAASFSSTADAAPAPAPEMAPAFRPTVWGDFFVKYSQPPQKSETWMEERASELKDEVRELFESCKGVVEEMNLVDVLQRLGIDHHFEDKIETVIRDIHGAEFHSSSLHDVALRFRLLREKGYWVSPDEFDQFRHEDGSFTMDVTSDPKGLLSLYNASYLLGKDEEKLEEAIVFARHHLELVKGSLELPLAEQVRRTLEMPLPRTLKRLEALNNISEYNKQDEMYHPSIVELAKLDFNILQKLHQKELKDISQWWEDLSKEIGLDYARDRVVETYFVSYAIYSKQDHTRARLILTKLNVLLTLLDDTFDVRASLEECRQLNEAIQRWEDSAAFILPDYLKKYFLSMTRIFREIEDELEPHEKYRNAYNRRVFQTISSCFLQEAEWFHHNYTPSFEEHVKVSRVTGGCSQVAVTLLVGMSDDIATELAFEWAIGCPDAGMAIGEMARFMDDLATSKVGKDKMDVATTVECYRKEHGVTSEVAQARIGALVEGGWRTLNQARFDQRRALLPVVERVTNFARCMALLYHDKRDGFTNAGDLEDTLRSHFVDPIPL